MSLIFFFFLKKIGKGFQTQVTQVREGNQGQPELSPHTSKQTQALGTYPNWAFKGSDVALLFSLNLV